MGNASTSVRILEPVVVKPEALSKMASINDGIASEKMNGKAPKKTVRSQDKPVMARASRT